MSAIVEIISKKDCHLCDVAKETLNIIRQSRPFELRVRLLEETDADYEQFKERIPVVLVNGKFAFQYRVNEKELLKLLAQEVQP